MYRHLYIDSFIIVYCPYSTYLNNDNDPNWQLPHIARHCVTDGVIASHLLIRVQQS